MAPFPAGLAGTHHRFENEVGPGPLRLREPNLSRPGAGSVRRSSQPGQPRGRRITTEACADLRLYGQDSITRLREAFRTLLEDCDRRTSTHRWSRGHWRARPSLRSL